MNFAIAWIAAIRKWFQEYFEAQKLKKLIILKGWRGDYCTVLQIDSEIQGCRAAYRVIPHDRKQEDWVIQLFHLAEFRAKIDGIGFDKDEFSNRAYTRNGTRRNYSRSKSAAYRVSVHRVLSTGKSKLWVAIDCDLEHNILNKSATLAVLLPTQVVQKMLLNYVIKIPNPEHFQWQEQMQQVDWLGLLQYAAEDVIDPKHNLHAIVMWRADRRNFWD